MPSISYHLTLFVLKIKGIKKTFSRSPINYKSLRKEDIHRPGKSIFKPNTAKQFTIEQSTVTEITPKDPPNGFLILYCPGGAFVSGPAKHQWDSLSHLVAHTNSIGWMVDYPKAPEHQILELSKNLEAVYKKALEQFEANKIILTGDSVGATLHMLLLQQLIKNQTALPAKLIGISPIMDSSLTNPDIDRIDKVDPMLSKAGMLSAKKMCAGNIDLKDPVISPLYGSFEGFPDTTLFVATKDVSFADQEIAIEKMKQANVQLEVISGQGMPHIWPILPVMKEAKDALDVLTDQIKQLTQK